MYHEKNDDAFTPYRRKAATPATARRPAGAAVGKEPAPLPPVVLEAAGPEADELAAPTVELTAVVTVVGVPLLVRTLVTLLTTAVTLLTTEETEEPAPPAMLETELLRAPVAEVMVETMLEPSVTMVVTEAPVPVGEGTGRLVGPPVPVDEVEEPPGRATGLPLEAQ